MSETISSGVTLSIPTLGQVNWDQILKTQCFIPLSAHDHTGSGNGVQLGTSAFQDDAVDDRKTKLRNNQWFRGRNAGDSADINILRVNASNLVEFPAGSIIGSSLAADSVDDTKIRLRNSTTLRGRNVGDSGDVSLIGISSSDHTVIGAASGKKIELYSGGVLQMSLNGSGQLLSNVAAGAIGNAADNALLSFYGGTSSTSGGIDAYGGSHASLPGRVNIYGGTTAGIISLMTRGSAATIQFATQSTGRHTITAAGHLTPVAANAYDLGASSAAYNNVYGNAFRLASGSDLSILNDSNASILFSTNGSQRWSIQAAGHLVPAAATTYNLGSNGLRINSLKINTIDALGSIQTTGPIYAGSYNAIVGDPEITNGTARWVFGDVLTLTNVSTSNIAVGAQAGVLRVVIGSTTYKVPLYS